jgi:chromatin segregation and condensation protein Rec8/ScpA/Scc1 (kleisin family)
MAAATLVRHDAGEELGLVAPPEIMIESEAFSGSLGALFKLAKERRIELRGVALAPICASYWSYVVECQERDFEAAAAALVALAYLLERKAWAILPSSVPEPEEAEDLEARLPWVSEFSEAILALAGRAEERDSWFFRSADADGTYELPFECEGVSPSDLAAAFERVLARARPDPPQHVGKPARTLSDVIAGVLRALRPEPARLEDLLPEGYTRSDCVWWFLALLELMRLGQALASVGEGGAEFRLALAEGGGR